MEKDLKFKIVCPVLKQEIKTKKAVWTKYKHPFFLKLIDELFGASETLKITREDIFATEDIPQKIFKTILWGYPKGMRGKNFAFFLEKSLDVISFFSELSQGQNNSISIFELQNLLAEKNGLGLTTLSKLLYFFEVKIGNEACLILDKRVLLALNKDRIRKLYSFKSAPSKTPAFYLNYISQTNALATNMKVKADNIEYYMFTHFKD